MDTYSLLRTFGSLATVLGMLAGALWIVRRYGIRLPGRVGGGDIQRLELVERTALDGRRSVALLRRDGREHLILLAPEGNVVIEAGIIRDATDLEAEATRLEAHREATEAAKAQTEAVRQSFFALVDKAREAVKDGSEAAHPFLAKVRTHLKPAAERAAPDTIEISHA
jgi:flagellar biogenesis protein FliO